jgi:integrase
VVVAKKRTLTPEEFDLLITAIPDRYRLMVETAIETGMRWGELIAQKPRHVDFLRKTITVADTTRRSLGGTPPPANATCPRPTPRTTSPGPSPCDRTGSTPSPSTSAPTARP